MKTEDFPRTLVVACNLWIYCQRILGTADRLNQALQLDRCQDLLRPTRLTARYVLADQFGSKKTGSLMSSSGRLQPADCFLVQADGSEVSGIPRR